MSDLPRIKFRRSLSTWLAHLPRNTQAGIIIPDTRLLSFGFPRGSHGQVRCWVYRRATTPLEMYLAFYENFTPDDLICKVVPSGTPTRAGEGATIQFNGSKCMIATGTEVTILRHDGRVTVGHAIRRQDLVTAINKSAPGGLALLGGLTEWPLELGYTNDLSKLFDRMFIYAYCVEQAKRLLRDEALLPKLGY